MTRFFKTSLLLLAFANAAMDLCAQADAENKVVTLTVVGQGNTQDAARQSALRNAIEQAFGTFISSRTEVLNDQLIKDEIVSVSSGNIQAFDVLSEVEIPGGGYSSSLKATVSIGRLTSFVESKGIEVEFKGGLFAMNIKQQQLNEESEYKAMVELADVIKKISDRSFDFFINAGTPMANGQEWTIPLVVTVKPNANLDRIPEYLRQVLAGLSMSPDEVDNYRKLNKPWYSVAIRAEAASNVLSYSTLPNGLRAAQQADSKLGYDLYALRELRSIQELSMAIEHFAISLRGFVIDDGISEHSITDFGVVFHKFNPDRIISPQFSSPYPILKGWSDEFRPILLIGKKEGFRWVSILPSLVLYKYPLGFDDYSSIPRDALLHIEGHYGPKNVFPSVKDVATSNWGSGMLLQFLKLTDEAGVAATFTLMDKKTLSELEKVSGYTIRSTAP